MKNLMLAQSGGPTAAINATMAGAIKLALTSSGVEKIYGAIHGVVGLIEDNVIDISDIFYDPQNLSLLAATPAAALGSCRYKMGDDKAVYKRIIDTLIKYEVGYFVYIGGNDSMDTVLKLSRYCKDNSIDIKIMGAPKTIDNDLCETDHTPGFGTAAKYIAVSVSELFRDISVYSSPNVLVCEIMGRHAGWLTCAAALANINGQGGAQLIYVPEVPFSEERFLEDVRKALTTTPFVIVAVSEGVKDANGELICERQGGAKTSDVFGHKNLSGVGQYLGGLVKREIGCKTRHIEFNLLQRCSAHIASKADIDEAHMLGAAALDRALNGGSGEMSVIKRISSKPYKFKIGTTHIENVANREKTVPLEWLNEERNNVTQEMIDYLAPLIYGEYQVKYKNGIPEHIKLY